MVEMHVLESFTSFQNQNKYEYFCHLGGVIFFFKIMMRSSMINDAVIVEETVEGRFMDEAIILH